MRAPLLSSGGSRQLPGQRRCAGSHRAGLDKGSRSYRWKRVSQSLPYLPIYLGRCCVLGWCGDDAGWVGLDRRKLPTHNSLTTSLFPLSVGLVMSCCHMRILLQSKPKHSRYFACKPLQQGLTVDRCTGCVMDSTLISRTHAIFQYDKPSVS